MNRMPLRLAAGLLLLAARAAAAQAPGDVAPAPSGAEAAKSAPAAPPHGAGADLFYASDADATEVIRAGIVLDLRYEGPEKHLGLRLERAWFNPSGQGWQASDRLYLRAADRLGKWQWNARVGTDGDTLLGSAAIHNEARFRQEYFIEREIVETPQGLARGLYQTFVGAARDLPLDDRSLFTVVVGVQKFTGRNLRTHVRANFIHVVKPGWGLSAQLRTRYFRSSHPGEYDYYSPLWYAELLPVLQVRRFSGGWRYLAAAGLGAQRDAASRWRQSRYAAFRVTSPARRHGWALEAGLTYTNTPVASGFTYRYVQFNLGLARSF